MNYILTFEFFGSNDTLRYRIDESQKVLMETLDHEDLIHEDVRWSIIPESEDILTDLTQQANECSPFTRSSLLKK